MATTESLAKAAQAWCRESTKNLEMPPALCEVFAEILDETETETFKEIRIWIEMVKKQLLEIEDLIKRIPSTEPPVDISFKQAFGVFVKALIEDEDLYRGYKDNIAMAFYDAMRNAKYDFPDLHAIANRAAVNFLNLLILGKQDGKDEIIGIKENTTIRPI